MPQVVSYLKQQCEAAMATNSSATTRQVRGLVAQGDVGLAGAVASTWTVPP